MSLNLNAGEFDGGEVWFPEFGRQTFVPPAGGAVVFSCSLLHEALPVTKGKRYVFLPFLYDDAADKVRQQNEKYIAGPINTPEDADRVMKNTDAIGFVGASSLERMGVEESLTNLTRKFKTLKAPAAVKFGK